MNYRYNQEKIMVGDRVAYWYSDIWFGTVVEVDYAYILIRPDEGSPNKLHKGLEKSRSKYVTKLPPDLKLKNSFP